MLVTQTMAFSSTALKETPKLQDTWNRAPTKKRQVTALSSEPAPHFLPALKPIFFFFFGGKTIRSSPERGFYRPPPRAPPGAPVRPRPACTAAGSPGARPRPFCSACPPPPASRGPCGCSRGAGRAWSGGRCA